MSYSPYVPTYQAADISTIAIDGLGTFLQQLVPFAPIIALVVLGVLAVNAFVRRR